MRVLRDDLKAEHPLVPLDRLVPVGNKELDVVDLLHTKSVARIGGRHRVVLLGSTMRIPRPSGPFLSNLVTHHRRPRNRAATIKDRRRGGRSIEGTESRGKQGSLC